MSKPIDLRLLSVLPLSSVCVTFNKTLTASSFGFLSIKWEKYYHVSPLGFSETSPFGVCQ